MRIKYNTPAALITLIITVCLVSSCDRIPTQVITTEPVEKVAVAKISEKDGSGLTGEARLAEVQVRTGGGARIGCGAIELVE